MVLFFFFLFIVLRLDFRLLQRPQLTSEMVLLERAFHSDEKTLLLDEKRQAEEDPGKLFQTEGIDSQSRLVCQFSNSPQMKRYQILSRACCIST